MLQGIHEKKFYKKIPILIYCMGTTSTRRIAIVYERLAMSWVMIYTDYFCVLVGFLHF